MIQSDSIRKLAKKLGIDSKSSGIYGAIEDLADGFPFGEETKVVNTVVYDETFTANVAGDYMFEDGYPLSGLNEGDFCTITLNDEVFENIEVVMVQAGEGVYFGDYSILFPATNDFGSMSPVTEGETYHLKIETAEVQTVVTQLPAKFIPAGAGGGGGGLTITKELIEIGMCGVSSADHTGTTNATLIEGTEYVVKLAQIRGNFEAEYKLKAHSVTVVEGEIYIPGLGGDNYPFTIEEQNVTLRDGYCYIYIYRECDCITGLKSINNIDVKLYIDETLNFKAVSN